MLRAVGEQAYEAGASETVRTLGRCESDADEYWMHVSQQDELPIAGVVADIAPPDALARLLDELEAVAVDDFPALLERELLRQPSLLDELRLLLSLSDKRLYLELSYIFSRCYVAETGTTLCGCGPHELRRHSVSFFKNILGRATKPIEAALAARVIADYLAQRGLFEILSLYRRLPLGERQTMFTHLIVPGEAQQREAKRRGHGAEQALARTLIALGCSIVPANKAENPLAADPNIDPQTFEVTQREPGVTASFDVLVTEATGRVRVCVQSLVQSSDPGQFGVEKAKDTLAARELVDRFDENVDQTRTVYLWGLLDGVGYSENKNGTLNPMLGAVHTFVQVKTLFKAGLALHDMGIVDVAAIAFDRTFYSDTTLATMTAKYVPAGVAVIGEGDVPSGTTGIVAGKATLFIRT